MDQESVVYGCIRNALERPGDLQRRHQNREVMLSLPTLEGWPILYQEMFSLPAVDQYSGEVCTDVLHFGASYKSIEYEWDQWIAKFEELLSQMYWVSATVHLETELSGTHTFNWHSSGNCHIPGSGDMRVHCEWSHDGSLSV